MPRIFLISTFSLGVAGLLCATAQAQYNSNLSSHDQYVHQQSEYNTKYFRNADNYPAPYTPAQRTYTPPVYRRYTVEREPTYKYTPTSRDIAAARARTDPYAGYFEEQRTKALHGDIDAKVKLASCYYMGDGVGMDKQAAFALYAEAGATVEYAAQMSAAMLLTGNWTMPDGFNGRIRVMRQAAGFGYAPAQAWLDRQKISLKGKPGVFYAPPLESLRMQPPPLPDWLPAAVAAKEYDRVVNYSEELMNGEGTPKDTVHGLQFLETAAAAGNARASFLLGLANLQGNGLPVNLEAANRFFLTADAAGIPAASYHLAEIAFRNEPGHPADLPAFRKWAAESEKNDPGGRSDYFMGVAESQLGHEAKEREWFVKAAASHEERAEFALAHMQLEGTGGPVDIAKGLETLRQAARSMDEAKYEYGMILLTGAYGMKVDKAAAYDLFDQASLKNLKAAHMMAIAFATGDGRPKNDFFAALRAVGPARAGSPDDQLLLAKLVRNGDKVRHDPEESLMWMQKAAANGNAEAKAALASGFNGQP